LARISDAASKLGAEPNSPLRLVVAGSTRVSSRRNGEGGPFYNESVLFNHRGEEIGRQRKLHRWNLDSDLRTIYGLQPDCSMRKQGLLYEYIEPGDAMCILESPRLGRLAVLICESLGRTQPGMWILENMRLDWLFTPVLDRSLEQWRLAKLDSRLPELVGAGWLSLTAWHLP
jgi:predicted amidohydrolase